MGTLTTSLQGMIASAANAAGVPVGLYTGLVQQESQFDPYAVSGTGAYGYSQLMPGTAQDLGVNRFDAQQNLNGGATYLRQMYDKFGNWGDAVAAYNAGPGAWSNILAGKQTESAETKAYIPAVFNYAQQYGFTDSSQPAPTPGGNSVNQGPQGNATQSPSLYQSISDLMTKYGLLGPNGAPGFSNSPGGQVTAAQTGQGETGVFSLMADVDKLFQADFWRNAAALIAVLIFAVAFMVFGGYRLINSK